MNCPTGTIIMWIGTTAPDGWVALGGDYEGGLIVGYNNSTPSSYTSPTKISGSTHSHTISSTSASASFSHSHGSSANMKLSGGGSGVLSAGSGGTGSPENNHGHDTCSLTLASETDTHTHPITIAVGNATIDSVMPQYKTVILIKKT